MKYVIFNAKNLVTLSILSTSLCGSQTLFADQFMKLKKVRFANPSHIIGGTNISSISANRKNMSTTLPINLSKNLKIYFTYDFAGKSKHGNVEHANINPTNHQNLINCKVHSAGHSSSSKNKFGECTANKAYLNQLNSPAAINLRFNSPGGGGNKNLTWTINPSLVQNEIDRVDPPSSITLGNLFSGEIILAKAVTSRKTIRWGLSPKSCFNLLGNRRPAASSNSVLLGQVTFQPGEIKRTVEAQSKTTGCNSTSASFKAWWDGNHNTQPSKQKTFTMRAPRN